MSLPSLPEATRVWARIGLLSFGGPAGQIALMHRELVEDRRWIGEARFLHALSYCMLLPGPEAQQLATYIGWLLHGRRGGLIAGGLFILPGVLVMLGLSTLYTLYHQAPLTGALFHGLKAAVLALVMDAVLRLGRRALRGWPSLAVAGLAFLALAVAHLPFPLVVLAAAIIGMAARRFFAPTATTAGGDALLDRQLEAAVPPHAQPSRGRALATLALWLPLWLGPLAVLRLVTGADSVWTHLALFFSGMALVTFGGAYAVLAYVAQAAVTGYGWLTPGEMIDGLGLAETTPGPLVLVLQHVGFLAAAHAPGTLPPPLAGFLGALLTSWVTFAPCFLWIFLGGPYVERVRTNTTITAALAAITAAVVGVILNLAVWFGWHVLFSGSRPLNLGPFSLSLPTGPDIPAALLALVAFIALRHTRLGLLPTLAACAMVGVLLNVLGI
ncbi:chromate efflux transporter [Nitrospirillum amazonense]|uniref:Chromate transporter n=1 Tax=Nitrospirillum amazonense TaxID=28077 RepID=A0A560KGM3_9PROT|nr:chromate efflux transporter [Nitrospirillum amazonense]MDG3443488.1 chromate efflux transporter [Nitrospirillum amazonense]TWB82372.1 chromate transporter [Nitrospirillum amazonense]